MPICYEQNFIDLLLLDYSNVGIFWKYKKKNDYKLWEETINVKTKFSEG